MISVIVPIFNSEKFLIPCLESILAQSYVNFEIICVDDGSTDQSLKLCENYAEADDRIRVYHKTNGGVSSARNFGLRQSRGDLICFIDSDDYVAKDFLNTLYTTMGTDTDMSVCNWMREEDSASQTNVSISTFTPANYASKIFCRDKWPAIVCMLFKKSIITDYTILFNEKFFWGEDSEFFIHYISCCKKSISVSNYKGYVYRRNSESAMHTLSSRSLSAIEAAKSSERWLSENLAMDKKKLFHKAGTIAKLLYMASRNNAHDIYLLIHKKYNVDDEIKCLLRESDIRKRLFALVYLCVGPSVFYKIVKSTR